MELEVGSGSYFSLVRAFQAYKLIWVCPEIGESGKEGAVRTDHMTRNVPRSC